MTNSEEPETNSDLPSGLQKALAHAFGDTVVHASSEDTSGVIGEQTGDQIGRYELLQRLGEGGMGSVWMADQQEPVQRRVALKVIKMGMDTREVVARFEAERQALALMEHPHIAKVFDGGATKEGRPYFVMELVDGIPITEYCDQATLGLRERLLLFASVCDAVQHAHQKGIIHRDIKPSNVLVTQHDGVATPKVIDFGIAKATNVELTRKTLLTRHAQVVGTPEYMAPEQAEASGIDIDTRADVYSLGALLYELLTGTKLFDERRAWDVGIHELLRVIREVEPQKPSTRISTLGEGASVIATRRRSSLVSLRRGLTGDLDWIVMKALEKERSRRYETASAFADDVRRFLDHQPVHAAQPSAVYRFRKLVRRRRKMVAVVSAIAGTFVAGSIGTGVGWWNTQKANRSLGIALEEKADALEEEERQRQLAQENEDLARQNEARAKEAQAEAREEAQRARAAEAETAQRAAELERVATFQAARLRVIEPEEMGLWLRENVIAATAPEVRGQLLAMLEPVNFTTVALGLMEAKVFDKSLEAIDTEFVDQPVVQARLLASHGWTLHNLGLVSDADEPLARALELQQQHLGAEHPDTLASANDLALVLRGQRREKEAEVLFRETLEARRRVLGDEDDATLASMANLGFAYEGLGRLEEARDLFEEVLRIRGADDPGRPIQLSNLGIVSMREGDMEKAATWFRQAIDEGRRLLGEDDPDTVMALTNLAACYQESGKSEAALPLVEESLAARRRFLGDDHPQTLVALNITASVLSSLGRYDEAAAHLQESLDGRLKLYGKAHQETIRARCNYAMLLVSMGRADEGLELASEVAQNARDFLAEDHPFIVWTTMCHGALLSQRGDLEAAEPLLRDAVERGRSKLPDNHAHTRNAEIGLGLHLQRLQAHLTSLRNPDSPGAAEPSRIGEVAARAGSLQLLLARPAQAEALLWDAVDFIDPSDPSKSLQHARAIIDLGIAISRQQRFDEAEGLLIEGTSALIESVAAAPAAYSVTVTALEDTIQFYDEWHTASPKEGHDVQAAAWREQLRTLQEAKQGK